MVERVLNAFAQRSSYAGHQFRAQAAPNRVAAQRQRKAGDFLPPLAEIDDAVETCLVVRQLSLVNDEASFVFSFEHLRDDLIERDNFGFDAGGKKIQSQIRSG